MFPYVLVVLFLNKVTGLQLDKISCPNECRCYDQSGLLSIECNQGGFTDSTLQKVLEKMPKTANIIKIVGPENRPNSFSITRNLLRFKQLEQLHLVNCGLKSLGKRVFAGLKTLHTLNIERNSINYLSVETFERTAQIGSLNLAHNLLGLNPLPTGAFAYLKHLQFLSLAHNNISQVSRNLFGGLLELQTLIMDGNKLKAEDVSSLLGDAPRLRRLEINHCDLGMLDEETFSKGPYIESLGLGFNGLSKLGLRSITLALHPMKRLRTLNLSGNRFTLIDSNVFYRMKLSSLSLAHNDLGLCYSPEQQCEHGIQPMAFSGIPLTFLDLSFNGYRQFHSKILGDAQKTVRILDISGNPLGQILAEQTADMELNALHIAQTGLRFVPDKLPTQYHDLQLLNLSRNSLNYLSSEAMTQLKRNLRKLDISKCNFTAIPSYLHFGLISRLDTVYLYGNPWDCRCHVSQLRNLILNQASRSHQLQLNQVQCATPEKMKGISLVNPTFQPAGCGVIFGASSGLTQESEIGILIAILCGILLFCTLLVTVTCWGRKKRKGTYNTKEGSRTNLSSAAESMVGSNHSHVPLAPKASAAERLF